MVYGRKQASKQANIHTHVSNAVPLVWGSLRLAPNIQGFMRHTGNILAYTVNCIRASRIVQEKCLPEAGRASSSLVDLTIKCACFLSGTWHHLLNKCALNRVHDGGERLSKTMASRTLLYLMHICLINDAVYQEGSMHLINIMRLTARCG